MRFSSLLRRLRALEPASARPRPWPPTEGSFSYWLWDALGRLGERRSYADMYLDFGIMFLKRRGGQSIVIRGICDFCNASNLGCWPTKRSNIDV
jgi:hypothetical protein